MANTISPNMNLIVPSIGNEIGPQYAFDINNSLALIDQHDHSPGKGVQITPAGMNINATLNFQDNLASNLEGVEFENQPSALTSLGTLSVAPGGGSGIGDLYYTDYAGNTIQLTKSGQVNVVASSIPGESYSAGTFIWDQTQSGLPTTPANFDIGSITLRPNVAATTYGTQLVPPSTGNYTINLPVPTAEGYSGVPNFVTMNNSGQQQNTYYLDDSTLDASGNVIQVAPGGITSTQIASGTITGSNIASGTVTGSNIASATITGSNIGNNTVNPANLTGISSATFSTLSGYSNNTTTFTDIVSVGYSQVAPTLRPLCVTFSGPPIVLGIGTQSCTFRVIVRTGISGTPTVLYEETLDNGNAITRIMASTFNFVGSAGVSWNQIALQTAQGTGGGVATTVAAGFTITVFGI